MDAGGKPRWQRKTRAEGHFHFESYSPADLHLHVRAFKRALVYNWQWKDIPLELSPSAVNFAEVLSLAACRIQLAAIILDRQQLSRRELVAMTSRADPEL